MILGINDFNIFREIISNQIIQEAKISPLQVKNRNHWFRIDGPSTSNASSNVMPEEIILSSSEDEPTTSKPVTVFQFTFPPTPTNSSNKTMDSEDRNEDMDSDEEV